MKINFASDNYAGIHPEILKAIVDANHDPAPAYGNDYYSNKAIAKFKELFTDDIDVFFVLNGTAANVTALSTMNRGYHAIICADTAHIQIDECGAPEKFIGSKLLVVPTINGKCTLEQIKHRLYRLGDQHHVQPHAISISQSTEYGTVYTFDEIKAIAEFAHANQLYLHMDGARFANAEAHLKIGLKTFSKEAGVDVLSFGGTKNGMMLGEAVIFFNRHLAHDFLFIRKQSMQLASKMRFIAAQFHALLSNNLWHTNAKHANDMATLLAKKLSTIPGMKITHAVEANAVFVIMPEPLIQSLQEKYYFYVWNENLSEVRLMTSFNTTESEIDAFIQDIQQLE